MPTAETMAASQYAVLYKNKDSMERRQSDRRQQLLEEQKQHRNQDQDTSRGIEQFLEKLQQKSRKNNRKEHKSSFKGFLQLSEWLHERPDDLDNWFLVPCPKGKRCLVVATNGSTKMYTKWGAFQKKIRSTLPGDRNLKSTTTILDCFAVECEGSTIYMVVDVMCYANTEMLNCDTSLRFFWIDSKLKELDMETISFHNEFVFKPMKYVDCSDETAVNNCLTTYPMWDDDKISLDGLLFYHKESSYVHGTTPLVGWLFPFMVNEVLGYCMINPEYLERRPVNYTNAQKYIEEFEKKQKKRNRAHVQEISKMDEDLDEDNLGSLLDAERRLEMDGAANDDIYYEKID